MKKNVLLFAFVVGMIGCAPKTPDLFPNEKMSRTPRERVNSDVDYCMSLADEYVHEPNKYSEAAKQGLIGGAVGAGTGAVGGAIMGNAGRATATGAAIGGILGVLNGLYETSEHSPSYQRFVEYCLQKKGYEVTGWSSK